MGPVVKRRRLTPPTTSEEDSHSDEVTGNDFFSRASKWNLEQDYEQRPRHKKAKDRENTRLPIKTAEGRVEPLQVANIPEEANKDSPLDSDVTADSSVEELEAKEKESPTVPVRQQIIEAKDELARVASLINEDPEEHAGAFRTFAQIAASPNVTIKKLALGVQLAVYKDVVPGYRIRPLAETDMTEKVSKEVRRLRAFEQALVSSYQAYLRDLAKYTRDSKCQGPEGTVSLSTVAVNCACALLLAVPHFNFRGDLLKILADRLSNKRVDNEFVKCRETIETLFQNDEDGTPSLDAVTILTRMMKARKYQVDESVLNTFLLLRLLTEFSSKASQTHIDKPANDISHGKKPKFKKEFRTKKQRKLLKERKVVEKEFKEADATVSHEERDRMQAETLKLVFVTYFQILKLRSPSLMGAVLEGLAKYAHLVNQDFFVDLLEALKDILSRLSPSSLDPDSSEKSPTTTTHTSQDPHRSTLLCINTAYTLLSGQDALRASSTLSLDLSFFTSTLYQVLHPLSLSPTLELQSHLPSSTQTHQKKINHITPTVLLLRALSSLLTPRTTPPIRLAAFTKTLHTISLQLPEKS